MLAGGALAAGVLALYSFAQRRPDLDSLARTLRGRLVVPRSPLLDQAHKLWNSRFDDTRPLAVVEVAGSDDVRKVVRFARDHHLQVIALNGGHSFGGYSTGDDVLVIAISQLNRVEVYGRTARIEAGVTFLPEHLLGRPDTSAIYARSRVNCTCCIDERRDARVAPVHDCAKTLGRLKTALLQTALAALCAARSTAAR